MKKTPILAVIVALVAIAAIIGLVLLVACNGSKKTDPTVTTVSNGSSSAPDSTPAPSGTTSAETTQGTTQGTTNPVEPSDIHDGNLVVVENDKYEYDKKIGTASNELGNLYSQTGKRDVIYKIAFSKVYMTNEAIDALNAMFTAFKTERMTVDGKLAGGAYPHISALNEKGLAGGSSYGSEFNTGLYFKLTFYIPTGAGVTESTHQVTEATYKADYDWLVAHAHEYGYILRFPNTTGKEAYFRYVGKDHATYMKAKDLTLEAYVTDIQTSHKTIETALQISELAGTVVMWSESKTYSGNDYELKYASGDNKSGYILTLQTKEGS